MNNKLIISNDSEQTFPHTDKYLDVIVTSCCMGHVIINHAIIVSPSLMLEHVFE